MKMLTLNHDTNLTKLAASVNDAVIAVEIFKNMFGGDANTPACSIFIHGKDYVFDKGATASELDALITERVSELSSFYQTTRKGGRAERFDSQTMRAWNLEECSKEVVFLAFGLIARIQKRNELGQDCAVPTHFEFTFNGATVIFDPFATGTSELIVNATQNEMTRLREEYEASDEYKEQQRRRVSELEAKQIEADACVAQLSQVLESKDHVKLLEWLIQFQDFSDHMHIKKDNKDIVRQLTEAGYQQNDLIGQKDVIRSSLENETKYLVGQAMDFLVNPPYAIHQLLSSHAEKVITTYKLPE